MAATQANFKTAVDGLEQEVDPRLNIAPALKLVTGLDLPVVSPVATYTMLDSDVVILAANAANMTVNLLTSVGRTGRLLIIVNIGAAGTVTIDPSGSQTINGSTTQDLASQWAAAILVSNGANWVGVIV